MTRLQRVVPLVEKLHAATGVLPGQILADAGYCSATNLDYAKTREAATGDRTEFFIATGRVEHGERVPEGAHGPEAADEKGPRRLCQAQSDRGTRVRADPHSARQIRSPAGVGASSPRMGGGRPLATT
jgi:hypothetical protein